MDNQLIVRSHLKYYYRQMLDLQGQEYLEDQLEVCESILDNFRCGAKISTVAISTDVIKEVLMEGCGL